jgi:P27 family predicted phage terminase small subunit
MPGTARSGRRPSPAALRALTGAKTRARHRGEPTYAKAIPPKPAFIEADPIASARWDEIAPRIASAGVLTEAHGEMLALLCSTWADLVRAREQFAEMGYRQIVLEERMTATGETVQTVKPNPLVVRIEKQAYQVARFLGEFGLTPMTAAKVSAEKAVEGGDPFAEFLDGDPYVQ